MSALAAYTLAQAQEMGARAGMNQAQTNLLQQQASNYGDESAARQAAQYGSAAASYGSANEANARAAAEPDLANAQVNNLNATANATGVQSRIALSRLPGEVTGQNLQNQAAALNNAFMPQRTQSDLDTASLLRRIQGTDVNTPVPGSGSSNSVIGSILRNLGIPGYAKGGIAGRDNAKPSKDDTVPAMLQPGEGVLNAGAVEHYGPDVIDQMNQMGMLRTKAKLELEKMAKGMGSAKQKAKKKAA